MYSLGHCAKRVSSRPWRSSDDAYDQVAHDGNHKHRRTAEEPDEHAGRALISEARKNKNVGTHLMRSFSLQAIRTSRRFIPPHHERNGLGIHHVKSHVSATHRLRAAVSLTSSTTSSSSTPRTSFSGMLRASNIGFP